MTAAELGIPRSLVDDFGEAQAAHEACKPTEAMYRKLGDELKGYLVSAKPAEAFVLVGDRYTLDISPQTFESVIDIPKARRKLGARNFLAAVTLTLKALGRFLTQPEIDQLVTKQQIGHRKYVASKLEDAE